MLKITSLSKGERLNLPIYKLPFAVVTAMFKDEASIIIKPDLRK